MPSGLLTKPTLVWKIYAGQAGNRDTETIYMTSGMSWRADYIAIVDNTDTKVDLSGWTTITNNSGTSYPETKLKLVAGDVHRVQEGPRYTEAFDNAVRSGNAAPEQFGTTQLFEYYLYTLERETDIQNNQNKQISLFTSQDVPVQKELVFEPQNTNYYYYGTQSTSKENAQVKLKFKNSEPQGLGLPIPKGIVRVYKNDTDGQLQFIGEDEIDHTKKDDEVELFLGNAFDVTGERIQTSREEVAKGLSREQYKIAIENAKDTAAVVKVKEHLYGNWTITQNSMPFEKKNSTEIEFTLNVPAKGRAEITYTVEYRYYY